MMRRRMKMMKKEEEKEDDDDDDEEDEDENEEQEEGSSASSASSSSSYHGSCGLVMIMTRRKDERGGGARRSVKLTGLEHPRVKYIPEEKNIFVVYSYSRCLGNMFVPGEGGGEGGKRERRKNRVETGHHGPTTHIPVGATMTEETFRERSARAQGLPADSWRMRTMRRRMRRRKMMMRMRMKRRRRRRRRRKMMKMMMMTVAFRSLHTHSGMASCGKCKSQDQDGRRRNHRQEHRLADGIDHNTQIGRLMGECWCYLMHVMGVFGVIREWI
jgi:hypothetical protein